MNTKTRSALRASLKQEDAALDERLPEALPAAATTPSDAAVAAPATKPRTRRTPLDRKNPVQPPARGLQRTEPPAAHASALSALPAIAIPPVPAQTRPKREPAVQAVTPSSAKPEKRQREAFSLAASDRRRLDELRDAMKAAGHPARKSDLVRAGLAALAALDNTAIIALLSVLPPLERASAKGDKVDKGRKKKSVKRKAAARKR